MSQTRLSRLPHFTFYQDEYEGVHEDPINVTYYNGSIELEQNGNEILIEPNHLKSLMKSVIKNFPEALAMLEKH